MRINLSLMLGAALLAGCGDDTLPAVQEEPLPSQLMVVGTEPDVCDGVCSPIAFTHQPSLVVTDPVVLERFEIRNVLDQLVAESGSAAVADDVWKQWWSTQRVRAVGDPAHHPYCDDNASTINGWPIECPRDESLLEGEVMETHTPVALFNRFDLAPMDGSNCGEYRIVYAKDGQAIPADPPVDPQVAGGRNFIIFEGVLPNPQPDCGLAACLPVAEFWQSLSTEPNSTVRADLLEEFYFKGICGFKPVVLPENYGLNGGGGGYGNGSGQIRTNQFISPSWLLKEFSLDFQMGELMVVPATVKANPHVDLFTGADPNFNTDYSNTIGTLLPNPDDVNLIALTTDPRFDAGESPADGGGPFLANEYFTTAGSGLETDTLTALNTMYGGPAPLSISELDSRATAQSCGGCHQLSNGANLGTSVSGGTALTWPNSNGFVHVDENSNLSPALTDPGMFLDHRADVLTDFLATSCGSSCFSPVIGPMIVKPSSPSNDRTPLADFDLVSASQFRRMSNQGQIPAFDTLSGHFTH